MEITLPENISEITLGQFLKYQELEARELDTYNHNKRKINIFTGIPVRDIDHIKAKDAERILSQIDLGLNTEAEFVPTFEMHGMTFGMIPNFDKMTLAEYADLSKHGVSTETLHNLMAVLFRPVTNSSGDKYDILGYNGTEEYAEMMKDMPLSVVNGALIFFYNLANELQTATLKYLDEELLKGIQPPSTSRILDGIQQLKNWLGTIFLKYQRC